MNLRITAGTAVIRVASILEGAPELAIMSVESAFLVFDFGALGLVESLDAIASMDRYVGGQIADANDDETIQALTSLKRAVLGLESDLRREHIIRDRAAAEAAETDAKSQLRATQTASINETSQQSSEAITDEEIVSDEQAQSEQAVEAGGKRRRG